MKRYVCQALIFILIISFFVSCSSEASGTKATVDELATLISSSVSLDEGYYSASESYCKYYFKDKDGRSLLGEIIGEENWTVQKSKSQSSENEFGIFIANDKNISDVKNACENYIETRKKSYLESKASYSPDEYEKFRDAEVFVSENYVIYLIMKKSDINIAKDSLSKLLDK
jgi:hypothetical protein